MDSGSASWNRLSVAPLGERMPPLVQGMAFPPDEWQRPGFELGFADGDSPPTDEEQAELIGRLGRYLNTFLVVVPEDHNVSLSPAASHAGRMHSMM